MLASSPSQSDLWSIPSNAIDFTIPASSVASAVVEHARPSIPTESSQSAHMGPKARKMAQKRKRQDSSVDAAISRGAEITFQAEERQRQRLMGMGLSKATLEFLYIRWVVNQDIALDQVTHPAFRSVLEHCNPIANQMLPYSSAAIRESAQRLFVEGKQRIRYLLATAISDIHITCNLWTSPNHIGMLAVVAHFTSEKLKLHAVTLSLTEVQRDDSGQNQAAVVLEVVKDYGILGKLGYFMMDNVGFNDELVRTIAPALLKAGIPYNVDQRRLRCNGQIINLAVQGFLFGRAVDDHDYPEKMAVSPTEIQPTQWRKLGPLGKLHNITVWIGENTQRIQAFKQRCGGFMPHRYNKTGMNYWYHMLGWTSKKKIKNAIMALSNEEADLADDVLTAKEWETLGLIRDFLQGFRDATIATKDRQAGLDEALLIMDFLSEWFENAIKTCENHPFMLERLHAGYDKLSKHWNMTERSPAYIAAIVLDPTVKWNYFDKWNPQWQPNMKSALRELWETSYRSSTGPVSRATPTSTPDTTNEFLIWLNKRRAVSLDVGDELAQYINEPLVPASDKPAIDWWLEKGQRERLPLLSRMAIDIYSIPAMSSEPERVLSGTKNTIPENRSRLDSETIGILECLKWWFQLDLFTDEDLHNIVADTEDEDFFTDWEDLGRR